MKQHTLLEVKINILWESSQNKNASFTLRLKKSVFHGQSMVIQHRDYANIASAWLSEG